MMKHTYHMHTIYSQHGDMTVDEVVELSIKAGFETVGFSEHHPVSGDSFDRIKDMAELDKYYNDISLAKEKYKDQIKIYAGLEVEPRGVTGNDLIPAIKEFQKDPRLEYLILGHHHYPNGNRIFETNQPIEMIEGYIDDLRRTLTETDILYIAHPDAIISGEGAITEKILWAFEEIVKLAVEFDKPLGINIKGQSIKREMKYPNIEFWKIAKKYNAKAIIEWDLHYKKDFTKEKYEWASKFAKDLGLNMVEKLI